MKPEAIVLSSEESKSLIACEKIIETGVKTVFEVGEALRVIRDGKLYRLTHENFGSYCDEKWGFSRPRAYQLIEASETKNDLSTMVDKRSKTLAIPQNERQIRPLSGLKKSEKSAAWKEATKDGKEPTEETVKEAVATIKNKMPPPLKARPVFDDIGREIPKHLHALWARRQEVQDLINAASKLRVAITRAMENNDPAFGRFSFSSTVIAAGNLYNALTLGKAYAVCAYCQGIGCKVCETGLVCKDAWGRVPKDKKDPVLKAIAEKNNAN